MTNETESDRNKLLNVEVALTIVDEAGIPLREGWANASFLAHGDGQLSIVDRATRQTIGVYAAGTWIRPRATDATVVAKL